MQYSFQMTLRTPRTFSNRSKRYVGPSFLGGIWMTIQFLFNEKLMKLTILRIKKIWKNRKSTNFEKKKSTNFEKKSTNFEKNQQILKKKNQQILKKNQQILKKINKFWKKKCNKFWKKKSTNFEQMNKWKKWADFGKMNELWKTNRKLVNYVLHMIGICKWFQHHLSAWAICRGDPKSLVCPTAKSVHIFLTFLISDNLFLSIRWIVKMFAVCPFKVP